MVNLFNMIVSLIGAGLFGQFSMFILFCVFVCTNEVAVSFLSDTAYTHSFNNTMPNCTVNCTWTVSNGTFRGLFNNSQDNISNLFYDNFNSQYFQVKTRLVFLYHW